MSLNLSKAILSPAEINTAGDFPLFPDAEFAYQVNANLTAPGDVPGAGQSFYAGEVIVWDADRGDGAGEYVVIGRGASESFNFDRLTGIAQITKPDGALVRQWQCTMQKSLSGVVLGWLWPSVTQDDLPDPDISIVNTLDEVIGRAYSSEIPGYWDIPISNLSGQITHYAARERLLNAEYVVFSDLPSNVNYLVLAP